MSIGAECSATHHANYKHVIDHYHINADMHGSLVNNGRIPFLSRCYMWLVSMRSRYATQAVLFIQFVHFTLPFTHPISHSSIHDIVHQTLGQHCLIRYNRGVSEASPPACIILCRPHALSHLTCFINYCWPHS